MPKLIATDEEMKMEIFFFSRTKLQEFKTFASEAKASSSSGGLDWISTNDALLALLWCCVTTARRYKDTNSDNNAMLKFVMAVNERPCCSYCWIT